MKHSLLNFVFLKVWTIFIFPMGTFKGTYLRSFGVERWGKSPKSEHILS